MVGNSPMPPRSAELPLAPNTAAFEKRWRIGELAKVWGVGRETIRKIFAVEPGVVRVRLGRRRTHTTYSIPASVAERVHNRLTANRD
jgi:hypothetical protein